MTPRRKVQAYTVVREPAWDREKMIPVRALWEIAAMAGNVHPSVTCVSQGKQSPEWLAGYTEILRRMSDALVSADLPSDGRITYDPELPFNKMVLADKKPPRSIRVSVSSACQFLLKTYGDEGPPEGMQRLFAHLQEGNKQNSVQVPPVIAIAASYKTGASFRDQTKANETKKSNLLSIFITALGIELWGRQTVEDNSDTLVEDIESVIKEYNIGHIHGIRSEVFVKAIRRGQELIAARKPKLQ